MCMSAGPCERREWEEKRLAHRELNSLVIQSSAFRTSPAHTTNHNTPDILLSCVRVLTHASKQSALPVTEMPGSEKCYHCFQRFRTALQYQEPKAKEGCLNRFHVVQNLPHVAFTTCGFALVTNLLIALMLPPVEELGNFKPLHCSGFPITCKLDPMQISTKVVMHKTAMGC